MKPVFGIDVTNDKMNDRSNADGFVACKLDEALEEELAEAQSNYDDVEEKAELPCLLWLLKTLAELAVFACGIAVLNGILEAGLKETFGRVGTVFYIGGAGAIVWLVLTVYESKYVAGKPTTDRH